MIIKNYINNYTVDFVILQMVINGQVGLFDKILLIMFIILEFIQRIYLISLVTAFL